MRPSARKRCSAAGRLMAYAGLITGTLFLLVVGLQYLSGAFTATLGQDAASHYVSGAMIHDYLSTGRLTDPVRYLVNYQEHYPLIGIGHWPPLYYLIEALWMFLFSGSQTSIILLSAAATTATALLLFSCSWRQYGLLVGALISLAFVSSPVVQDSSKTLMLDIPVALLCLMAMLAYSRYLANDRASSSVQFGLFASAALLVKGNAGCLALLPVVAVFVGRRFDLLRKPAFWLPVPIVTVLAGPWYYLTWFMAAAGFRYQLGFRYIYTAAIANTADLLHALGPVVFGLALIGLARICVGIGDGADRPKPTPLQICAASLAIAVFVFQLAVPSAIAARYMLTALPPLLILAVSEINHWSNRISGFFPDTGFRTAASWRTFGLFFSAISFLPLALQIPSTPHDGFREAARRVWQYRPKENPVVLIAADANGEAGTIARLAMQDVRRPSIFALRGSRLLGGGGYNNNDYEPRFGSAAAVMAQINRYKIPLVLFTKSQKRSNWTHLRQIEEAQRLYPSRWQLLYADRRHAPEILLYRISGNYVEKADKAAVGALSMPHALHH